MRYKRKKDVKLNSDNAKMLEDNIFDNEVDKKQHLKVFIADDVEIIVKTIENILKEDRRIELLGSANNGLEEYQKIIELKPDLVVTDNQMPGLNGIDVIEKIYNEDIKNKTKFIIITGDASDYKLIDKANKFEVFRIIRKPIDVETFKETINEFFIEKNSKGKENKKENSMVRVKNTDTKTKIWKKILTFFRIVK